MIAIAIIYDYWVMAMLIHFDIYFYLLLFGVLFFKFSGMQMYLKQKRIPRWIHGNNYIVDV